MNAKRYHVKVSDVHCNVGSCNYSKENFTLCFLIKVNIKGDLSFFPAVLNRNRKLHFVFLK